MTFLNNKYTKWYYQIIRQAQVRVLPDEYYYEIHHIIPKSLGGANNKDNLVKLTAREHYICHWLLTKMTEKKDKQKMCYAFWYFLTGATNAVNRDKYKINSHTYELIKRKISIYSHLMHVDKPKTEEAKQKMSISAKKRWKGVDRSGKNNNNWKNRIYITPWGEFYTTTEAIKNAPVKIDNWSLITYCKNPSKVIYHTVPNKSRFITREMVGKTYGEIGFNLRMES